MAMRIWIYYQLTKLFILTLAKHLAFYTVLQISSKFDIEYRFFSQNESVCSGETYHQPYNYTRELISIYNNNVCLSTKLRILREVYLLVSTFDTDMYNWVIRK